MSFILNAATPNNPLTGAELSFINVTSVLQVCTMIFSSWTHDKSGIDYFPYSDTIGTTNYLENEAWFVLHTSGVLLPFILYI